MCVCVCVKSMSMMQVWVTLPNYRVEKRSIIDITASCLNISLRCALYTGASFLLLPPFTFWLICVFDAGIKHVCVCVWVCICSQIYIIEFNSASYQVDARNTPFRMVFISSASKSSWKENVQRNIRVHSYLYVQTYSEYTHCACDLILAGLCASSCFLYLFWFTYFILPSWGCFSPPPLLFQL